MTNQTIIFDFDGTLADVMPVFKKIYSELAPKYGLRPIDDQKIKQLRSMPVWRVIFYVGLKPWRFGSLLRDGRLLFSKYKNEIELFDDMPRLVKQLHKNGNRLYILSSNSETTIRDILRRYDLDDEVKIMKRPKFFGKAGSISKLIAQNKFARKSTWMIGDEVRDVKAGNAARVNSVAVTWGLQSKQILMSKKPNHTMDSVSELAKLFNS
jgi:phosphoglycolate phosphatase